MTTIIPFPNRRPGASGHLPSLGAIVGALKRNYAVLDDVDKQFFALIYRVWQLGERAKIETIIECRSMAWSMCTRYGLDGTFTE